MMMIGLLVITILTIKECGCVTCNYGGMVIYMKSQWPGDVDLGKRSMDIVESGGNCFYCRKTGPTFNLVRCNQQWMTEAVTDCGLRSPAVNVLRSIVSSRYCWVLNEPERLKREEKYEGFITPCSGKFKTLDFLLNCPPPQVTTTKLTTTTTEVITTTNNPTNTSTGSVIQTSRIYDLTTTDSQLISSPGYISSSYENERESNTTSEIQVSTVVSSNESESSIMGSQQSITPRIQSTEISSVRNATVSDISSSELWASVSSDYQSPSLKTTIAGMSSQQDGHRLITSVSNDETRGFSTTLISSIKWSRDSLTTKGMSHSMKTSREVRSASELSKYVRASKSEMITSSDVQTSVTSRPAMKYSFSSQIDDIKPSDSSSLEVRTELRSSIVRGRVSSQRKGDMGLTSIEYDKHSENIPVSSQIEINYTETRMELVKERIKENSLLEKQYAKLTVDMVDLRLATIKWVRELGNSSHNRERRDLGQPSCINIGQSDKMKRYFVDCGPVPCLHSPSVGKRICGWDMIVSSKDGSSCRGWLCGPAMLYRVEAQSILEMIDDKTNTNYKWNELHKMIDKGNDGPEDAFYLIEKFLVAQLAGSTAADVILRKAMLEVKKDNIEEGLKLINALEKAERNIDKVAIRVSSNSKTMDDLSKTIRDMIRVGNDNKKEYIRSISENSNKINYLVNKLNDDYDKTKTWRSHVTKLIDNLMKATGSYLKSIDSSRAKVMSKLGLDLDRFVASDFFKTNITLEDYRMKKSEKNESEYELTLESLGITELRENRLRELNKTNKELNHLDKVLVQYGRDFKEIEKELAKGIQYTKKSLTSIGGISLGGLNLLGLSLFSGLGNSLLIIIIVIVVIMKCLCKSKEKYAVNYLR